MQVDRVEGVAVVGQGEGGRATAGVVNERGVRRLRVVKLSPAVPRAGLRLGQRGFGLLNPQHRLAELAVRWQPVAQRRCRTGVGRSLADAFGEIGEENAGLVELGRYISSLTLKRRPAGRHADVLSALLAMPPMKQAYAKPTIGADRGDAGIGPVADVVAQRDRRE